MFDWISHNKELFLQSHTEIGVSYQHALDLQTQHNHFAMNSMVSWGRVVNSRSVHMGEERAISSESTADLWKVKWGRSGWAAVAAWFLGSRVLLCPPRHWYMIISLTKSSTVLWTLFAFWKRNTIFFKCLWHFFDQELMRAVGGSLIIYDFPPTPCKRYFSKPWKREANQAVSCGHSGSLAFSVVNWSVFLNAPRLTFVFFFSVFVFLKHHYTFISAFLTFLFFSGIGCLLWKLLCFQHRNEDRMYWCFDCCTGLWKCMHTPCCSCTM